MVVAFVPVVPPSVETTKVEPDAATNTLPLVEIAKLFQDEFGTDNWVQVVFSPPGLSVVGITKLGASFTLVMFKLTVATPELSTPSFTLKVKVSVPA